MILIYADRCTVQIKRLKINLMEEIRLENYIQLEIISENVYFINDMI